MKRILPAVMAIWAGLAFAPGEAAEKDVVFGLNWVPHGGHVAFYAALKRGIYKAEGVEAKIVRGFGSADTAKRTADGRVDFGLADAPSAIAIRSRGGKVQLLGLLADRGLNVIFTLESSGIRKPQDISGKTIGEAAAGACITLFPAFAKVHGIKNWTHAVMAPSAKNPALLAGKVDTICTFLNLGPILRKGARKKGAKIHAIPFSDWGLDLAGTALIGPEKTVRNKKDLTKRFVRASFKGLAWAVEHPDEAVGIFVKLHPTKSREITRAEWDVWARHLVTDTAKRKGIGYMDPAKMARTVNITVEYMNLPPVKAEKLYTNEFLPKLFPKYTPAS